MSRTSEVARAADVHLSGGSLTHDTQMPSAPMERRVTVTEIARIAQVSVPAVSNWRKRYPDFPTPTESTPGGDLFTLEAVVAWLQRRGKTVLRAVRVGAQTLWELADSLRNDGLPSEEIALVVLQALVLRQLTADAVQASGRQAANDWLVLRNTPETGLRQSWERIVQLCASARAPWLARALQLPAAVPERALRNVVAMVDELWRQPDPWHNPEHTSGVASALLRKVQEAHAARIGDVATPASLTNLIVELLAPITGTVYDPAAGHAMILAAAAQAAGHANVELVGQEVSEHSWRVGVLHLALQGVPYTLHTGDTLRDDAFRGHLADRIALETPLGSRLTAPDSYFDERWRFGTTTSADWMWAQHLVHHLAPDGIGVMTVPVGALSRGGRDAQIRRGLVAEGELGAVIELPPKLVLGSSVALALLLFDRSRNTGARGVLFVDARQLGLARRGRANELLPEGITRIRAAVDAWRTGIAVDEPQFAAVATRADVLASAVDAFGPTPAVDLTPHRFVRYSTALDAETRTERIAALMDLASEARRALAGLAAVDHRVADAAGALQPAQDPDWPLIKLRDLLTDRPMTGNRLDADGSGEPRPWVATAFVSRSGGRLQEVPTDLTRGRLRGRLARRGDVLLAARGIEAGARRIGCATVDVPGELAYSDSLMLLSPDHDRLDPDYLRFALTATSGRGALAAVTTGSVIGNLRPDAVGEVELRVPQLEDQKRIVKALRAIEDIVGQLDDAVEQGTALFEALRDAAVAGQVVPRGEGLRQRDDLPAAQSPTMADPRTHPVGFLLDEAEIGRAYCWFTDDRAALEWCVTHVLVPRARDAGDDEACHDLHQRLEWARRQGFGLTTMAASLNAITEPSIRSVWCGPFEELRDGRTPHARYVCAEFWEREYAVGEPADPIRDEVETERQEPIPDDMLPAFIALLRKLA